MARRSTLSIEEPELIERILSYRRERGEEDLSASSPRARAPPQGLLSWFG
jgi:hypothetical protein